MTEGAAHFFVFAEDRQIYGPANVALLQEWTRQGLVSAESWIFDENTNCWRKAGELPELNGYLATPTPLPEAPKGPGGLSGGQLRRIRLFSDMTNEQAEKFVNLVEKVKVPAFQPIVKQGEHGDSMFLIMDGEARVSLKTRDKDETIAILGVGDFFGEIALLDAGPRSADVTANKECTLLQFSKKHLDQIVVQHPDLAAHFLTAMNRFLGGRLRKTNDRFAKAQLFAMGAAGQVSPPSGMKWKKT